jgi:hypothetical protein
MWAHVLRNSQSSDDVDGAWDLQDHGGMDGGMDGSMDGSMFDLMHLVMASLETA